MRHALRLTVTAALALGGVPATPAQEAPVRADTAALTLTHDPITCMVARQSPLIEASLEPPLAVRTARVYFRSARGAELFYVEMTSQAGRFVGILPPPDLGASPVTYSVEATATDDTQTQTPLIQATVVEDPRDCDGRFAADAPAGSPVAVFSIGGGPGAAPGFSGVAAAGATTAEAGTTGRFLTSTGALVFLGAAAIGVVTAIVVSGGEEPPPASPSQ